MKGKKYNIFISYIKSILDFNSYTVFFKNSFGRAFFYLFCLTLFLGSLSSLRPMLDYTNFINSTISGYNENVPDFTFKEGKLSVSQSNPLLYGDSAFAYIIDTVGTTDKSVLTGYQGGILITSTTVYEKDAFGQIQSFPLSAFDTMYITKDSLKQAIPVAKLLNIFIYSFSLISFFVLYLFKVLILSLFGILMNSIFKTRLNFSNIFKLSIYALTLSATFNVVINSINPSMNGLGTYFLLIYFGVGALYLLKALTVLKINEENKEL